MKIEQIKPQSLSLISRLWLVYEHFGHVEPDVAQNKYPLTLPLQ